MSRLADMLDVSMSAATGLVDRIEERGYVERIRVPSDRRVVLARITAGRTAVARRRRLGPERDPRADPRRTRREAADPTRRAMVDLRTAVDAIVTDHAIRGLPHTPAPREGVDTHGSVPGRRRIRLHPSLEEDPALGLSHREKMEILFAVMLGLFLGALDQTIVGPACRPSSPSWPATTTTSGPSRSTC